MKIDLIDTGYFYADGGAMFGAIPKTAWTRRYPSDEQNGCILAMRSMLIQTDCGRVILVDNGAGNKHLKQLSYYRFFELKDLNTELEKLGVLPDQVTDVVLTHLHFDHCGYTTQFDSDTQEYRITYPNATHWVSNSQWDNFNQPNALERGSFFPENMKAVADAKQLRLLTTDFTLCPGVELRIYDGHTPGQLVPYVKTTDTTWVFAGDVIPLAASISPEWISAYDTHPVTSYNEKIRMLEEAVSENQRIIFCHDAYTLWSTVKKVNDYFLKDEAHKQNS